MPRPLGENQAYALKCLTEHNAGTWYPGAGWIWANLSTTVRLLDSLVKRGLVTRVDKTRETKLYGGGVRRSSYPFYEVTTEGRQTAEERFPALRRRS